MWPMEAPFCGSRWGHWRTSVVFLIIGWPRCGTSAHAVCISRAKVGAATDHGVEISVVEAGPSRGRISRRLKGIDLGIGEIRWPRCGARETHGAA